MVISCFKTKLSISFPGRNSLRWVMSIHFLPSMGSAWPQTLLLTLGEKWEGRVARISGGNDRQGLRVKQGVVTHGWVCLLLSKGHPCYGPREPEREGLNLSKVALWMPIWACIISLVIVKKGEKDIPGLTDATVPPCLGPKRASRIHKLFSLTKEDDERQYVVRKSLNKEGEKPRTKTPTIQHLVTPTCPPTQIRCVALRKLRTKKSKGEAAEYAELLIKRIKKTKEKCQKQIAKRCRLSCLRAPTSKSESSQK